MVATATATVATVIAMATTTWRAFSFTSLLTHWGVLG